MIESSVTFDLALLTTLSQDKKPICRTLLTGNKSILPTLDKWEWQFSTSTNLQISVEGLPNCINYVYTAIAKFNTMISNKRFLKANLNSTTL